MTASHRLGQLAHAVVRARQESLGRTEADGGGRSDEVQPGHRRFAGPRQHGEAIQRLDLRPQLRGQEAEVGDVDAEAGAGDHVIDLNGRTLAVEFEAHPGSDRFGLDHLAAGQHVDDALDPILQPGRAGRTEYSPRLGDAHVPWQQAEGVRRVPHRAVPAFAQLRGGPADMPEPADLLRVRIHPGDLRPPHDQRGAGTGLVQQSRRLQGRLACSDHGDVAPGEHREVAVVSRVGQQVGRQASQFRGNVGVGQDTGGDHDAFRGQGFRFRESNFEAVAGLVDHRGGDVGNIGRELARVPAGVAGKSLKRDRSDPVHVGQFVLPAVLGHVIAAGRRGDAGGVGLGLQVHADRHVRFPGVHRLADDAVR